MGASVGSRSADACGGAIVVDEVDGGCTAVVGGDCVVGGTSGGRVSKVVVGVVVGTAVVDDVGGGSTATTGLVGGRGSCWPAAVVLELTRERHITHTTAAHMRNERITGASLDMTRAKARSLAKETGRSVLALSRDQPAHCGDRLNQTVCDGSGGGEISSC